MPLRVADTIAVLDELGLERAHYVGNSWGGRLGFGIGEHAADRVLSLVLGGQQPYAMDPAGPLVKAVTKALAASREPATYDRSSTRWRPSPTFHFRTSCARSGSTTTRQRSTPRGAALAEGAISVDLGAWRVRCLVYARAGDADFYEQARRAAGGDP